MVKALDIVIVADSSKYTLRMMTEGMIEGCRKSDDLKFNFVIVDGNKDTRGFKGCKTIVYDFDFNYNKCLNLGFRYTKSEYVAFCNNDLEFHQFWASKMLYVMSKEKIPSASPNERWSGVLGPVFGHEVGKHILGWCIVAKRSVMEKIGGFAEACKFWYSDNMYAEQLKKNNIKHALILGSHVTHIGSKTLRTQRTKRSLTLEQRAIFDDWRQRYWT